MLEGGTANYLFRLTRSNGETTIVKHAEPFVRSMASIAFPAERMKFEAAALQTMNAHLPHNEHVDVAIVYSYDESQQVLMMSDGGNLTLKQAYLDTTQDIQGYGRRLGHWLATLHTSTKPDDVEDNQIAKFIYQHSYKNLPEALSSYGYDNKVGEKVKNEYANLLLTDNENVCHGDFWPGNVLISADNKLTIIDWEMTRRGIGATDVAQFAAEALLMDRFKGDRGLLGAFLEAYVEGVGGKNSLSDTWKLRFAVHCGTHLAYWPTRVNWGDKDATKAVVGFGRDIIIRGLDKDWAWLRDTVLSPIF